MLQKRDFGVSVSNSTQEASLNNIIFILEGVLWPYGRIDQRRPMAQTRQLRITIFFILILNILDMTKLQVALIFTKHIRTYT
jgi:hypothetical protein